MKSYRVLFPPMAFKSTNQNACFAAVFARELCKAQMKWNPLHWISWAMDKDEVSSFQEYVLELSHEVEVSVALQLFEIDEVKYRKAESRSLRKKYKGLWDGLSERAVEHFMKVRKPKAHKWIAKNYLIVLKAHQAWARE